MQYIEAEIPHNEAVIYPIGDLHLSDKAFKKDSYKKLKEYVDEVEANPSARIILGGDLLNCAGRNTKTSPFEQRMSVSEEISEIVKILNPVKKKIVGAIEGNHEHRAKNEFDIDLTEVLCSKLDIPYLGTSAVVNFKVKRKQSSGGGKWRENYYLYFHHGTGGGQTLGGALNRSEKLANIVEGCDIYCIFHTHKLSTSKTDIFRANPFAKSVEKRTIHFVTCGGYMGYESYPEKFMMRPTCIGSPKIVLQGIRNEVNVHI